MTKGLAPREIEYWAATPFALELRSSGNGSRKIGGYAATFNSKSHDLGGFREVIENRAFAKSAADQFPGVSCRYEHRELLGTTAAGTLQLQIDTRGLDYTVDIPRSREDILELTERRDLRFSSFSFQAYEQNWTYEDSIPTRHLESVRLIDVAPVANPAYPSGPSVGLRGLAVQFNADPDDVYRMARENETSQAIRQDSRIQVYERASSPGLTDGNGESATDTV